MRAVLATCIVLSVLVLRAQTDTDAARIRASFLEMIARPRVPLAAATQPRTDAQSYRSEHFTFASEAGERVPGIFLTSARSTDRRPAVVFLHGTGSRKEEFLAIMRTFADRGFATAAIDARHHGARIARESGAGNAQYYAAMLDTYRTGKGRPYLYDTVWDVLRLVDYLATRADVDAGRIGLMGISKGGTEAYLAAAVDTRIAAAVPIIGVQGFRWALDNNQWQPRVGTFAPAVEGAARDSGVPVDATFVRRFYDRVVPGIYSDYDAGNMLALTAPRPVLVINGDSDALTPLPGVQDAIESAQRAYTQMGAAEKIGFYLQPNAGHVVTPVAELVMADWFVKWLAPLGLR
jgi:dienelactone hydrolase